MNVIPINRKEPLVATHKVLVNNGVLFICKRQFIGSDVWGQVVVLLDLVWGTQEDVAGYGTKGESLFKKQRGFK